MTTCRRVRRVQCMVGASVVLAAITVGCTGSSDGSFGEAVPSAEIPADSDFVGCLDCHEDFETGGQLSESVVLIFDHDEHDAASDVGCGSCHVVETHVGTESFGPTMDTCMECHDETAIAPLDCASCHPLWVVPSPPSHRDDEWAWVHGVPQVGDEPACTTCHSEEQFCAACHGLDMPHPEDFAERHAEAFFDKGDDACNTCHAPDVGSGARSDCDTCHHPAGNVGDPWLTAHPDVVNVDGEGSCSSCHQQTEFCTACHGFEMPHPDEWAATDHAISFFEGPVDGCSVCHGAVGSESTRTECDTCHHPGGNLDDPWIIAHPDASSGELATCFSCHSPTTCARCHIDGVKDLTADWALLFDVDE